MQFNTDPEWLKRRADAEDGMDVSVGCLSPEAHKARHLELHAALDELVADFIFHNRDARPSTSTILELIHWSFAQALHPTEKA